MTSRPPTQLHRTVARRPVLGAALLAGLLGLAVPTVASAAAQGSGGSGFGGSSTTASTSGTTTEPQSAPVGGPVSAQGNGFSLTSAAAGTYGHSLTVSGSAPAADSGQTLTIQRESAGGSWQDAASAAVASDGSFRVAWRANASGALALRAAVAPSSGPSGASPSLEVTVYRNSRATIYGPGLYGKQTACGQRLTRSTLGVASRTLACGTRVSIAYRGRSITVPVIDRGPFANGATWDLTEATATALRDRETETVGAAVVAGSASGASTSTSPTPTTTSPTSTTPSNQRAEG